MGPTYTVERTCAECGRYSESPTNTRKVVCPCCGTENDWWIDGEEPPERHRKQG